MRGSSLGHGDHQQPVYTLLFAFLWLSRFPCRHYWLDDAIKSRRNEAKYRGTVCWVSKRYFVWIKCINITRLSSWMWVAVIWILSGKRGHCTDAVKWHSSFIKSFTPTSWLSFHERHFKCILYNKSFVFWSEFHRSLFLMFQLPISQHWSA